MNENCHERVKIMWNQCWLVFFEWNIGKLKYVGCIKMIDWWKVKNEFNSLIWFCVNFPIDIFSHFCHSAGRLYAMNFLCSFECSYEFFISLENPWIADYWKTCVCHWRNKFKKKNSILFISSNFNPL